MHYKSCLITSWWKYSLRHEHSFRHFYKVCRTKHEGTKVNLKSWIEISRYREPKSSWLIWSTNDAHGIGNWDLETKRARSTSSHPYPISSHRWTIKRTKKREEKGGSGWKIASLPNILYELGMVENRNKKYSIH